METTKTASSIDELKSLKKRIEAEIARLKAKEKEEKEIEAKRVLWPATAEQVARVRQFAEAHGIKPSEAEFANLTRIAEILERRLRVKEPTYRYNAHASVKNGKRKMNQRAWKVSKSRKGQSVKQTNLPL